jgi:hypothetical protein
MADADGAAPISEWVKLRALAVRNSVVIGRRKSTQRKFSRLVLSLGFRMLIRLVSALLSPASSSSWPRIRRLPLPLSSGVLLTCAQVCGIPFPDTQCGFKLFTRPSAQLLFSNTYIKRCGLSPPPPPDPASLPNLMLHVSHTLTSCFVHVIHNAADLPSMLRFFSLQCRRI